MTAWTEFGAELKTARRAAHLSLREAAGRAWCSKSTVHRLESGEIVGRQQIVRSLDDAYGAGGTLTDTYGRLAHARWYSREERTVLEDRHARGSWQHTYPAYHSGDVWIGVRPTRAGVGRSCTISLHWGPWSQDVVVDRLDDTGVALVTGKSPDVVPVPLRVDVVPHAHVLFGTDDERSVDLAAARRIHAGWTDDERVPPPDGAADPAPAVVRSLLGAMDRAAADPSRDAQDRETLTRAVGLLREIGPDRLTRLVRQYDA